jgi:Domain of unknown function (DUF1963)
MSDLETFTRLNSRRASVLELGGFRPTQEPTASHFGLQPLGLPSEDFPLDGQGVPLEFICQLNLTQAPFVPDILADVQLITFFVDAAGRFIEQACPPDSWCIRAYTSVEGLVPLKSPTRNEASIHGLSRKHGLSSKRGAEARWSEAIDHPVYDDPDLGIPTGFKAVHLQNLRRSKIGGYPSNIQHAVMWTEMMMNQDGVLFNPLEGQVGFAFQIDSEAKVGLNWVDSGTVYVGRGLTDEIRDQWFVSCQFY